MPRFVVLHHRFAEADRRGDHFDLMLESGRQLLTWSLAIWPVGDQPAAATQLPPHRSDYLDYEGPVSGGRGEVRRVDQGSFEFLEPAPAGPPTAQSELPAQLELILNGTQAQGRYQLTRNTQDPQWTLSRK